MAVLSVTSFISFLLLIHQAPALQVTPSSPCAAVCLDDRSQDVSDPTKSNTHGSDIACSDSSYSATVVGEKFESCVNCLQNSAFSDSGENDQAWFLCKFHHISQGGDRKLISAIVRQCTLCIRYLPFRFCERKRPNFNTMLHRLSLWTSSDGLGGRKSRPNKEYIRLLFC